MYMKSLNVDHPDRIKFVLEQAAIRTNKGKPFTSHLVNLMEPNWEEKV